MLGDTISAVSTPRGKGGVAILRISGPQALSVAEKVFLPAGAHPLDATPRTARLGSMLAPVSSHTDWSAIDRGLALFFPEPGSFTGEDVVELHCHGGPLLTETLLSATFAAGARPAAAGEFTRRAFLNGKLSLTEAESLGMLIDAQTESQLSAASSGLARDNPLGKSLSALYERLTLLLSTAYARIDYPDEDLAELSDEEVLNSLSGLLGDLDRLLETYRTGHAVMEGIPCVLCGRTNAGKSSIYNRLAGSDKAIVTDIPGTTRDILECSVSVGEVLLKLRDTAGLRSSDGSDAVEQIGIRRALKALDEAELILTVVDLSRPLDDEDRMVFAAVRAACDRSPNTRALLVCNKSDLHPQKDLAPIWTALGRELPSVAVSAKTGEGFDQLTAFIRSLYIDEGVSLSSDPLLMNARQRACIVGAIDALTRAQTSLSAGYTFDLVSADLEEALESLGETDGRTVNEDIVASIFSHFCVGK